ncbi:hypothetical protein HO133_007057 [Letharia lupina]|uniref:Uncharacterized protein n=1 Tax=Letharia lupina TaxID=560253 RepID=A0A8H6KY28_9LECA|nr:uncharacterized protein HO133_007057 [Letharia lupina]KAF6228945.1 hypothetical protein HO133_007057 [Letharia lupina]
MNSYAERLASFTSWPHVCPSASTVARAGFRREYDPTFPSPDLTQKKKHRNQKTRQQYTRRSLQAVTQQEEEPLQQANAENTAEKSSDNKATISKNTAQLSTIPRHMLSTVPRQITTQQAENDTTIWPGISACLNNITLIWYITGMTSQEEDLLRRSQPIGSLQDGVRTMHIWTN